MRQLLSMGVTILLILVIIYVSKDAIQGVLGAYLKENEPEKYQAKLAKERARTAAIRQKENTKK